MGTKRICISGLTDSEMDLVELKIREVLTALLKATQLDRIMDVWRDDDTEEEEK